MDGVNGYGYLKIPDGTYYTDTLHISDDIYTWTSGSLADMNGKENTERIKLAGVVISSAINDFNLGLNNQGSSLWYLPTVGQCAYIIMNLDKVDRLLEIVEGDIISSNHALWTSTVYYTGAWYVSISGGVGYYTVDPRHPVRLVRDL